MQRRLASTCGTGTGNSPPGQEAGLLAVECHEIGLREDLEQEFVAGRPSVNIKLPSRKIPKTVVPLWLVSGPATDVAEPKRWAPSGGFTPTCPAAVTLLEIWAPTIAPVLGSTPRKLHPINRKAVRFNSAMRTLSITCCEPGTRSRLMILVGAIAPVTWIGPPISGRAIPAGSNPPPGTAPGSTGVG